MGRTNKYLIKHNIDKLLCRCAQKGCLIAVKYLVEHGANVNYDDNYALYISIKNHHFEITKYLINKGANVNKNSALCVAAQEGQYDLVVMLVEKGASIATNDFYPIMASVIGGHLDIVKYFALQNVDLTEYTCSNSPKCVLCASVEEGHLHILEYLISIGVKDDQNLLNLSISFGNLSIVTYLINQGFIIYNDSLNKC